MKHPLFKQTAIDTDLKTKYINDHRYMALDRRPLSLQASNLCESIAISVHQQLNRKYKSMAQHQAVGVFIADLLANAAIDFNRWGYREIGLEHFTGMPVGYKPFIAAVEGMKALGLLTVIVGETAGPSAWKKERDATRFRGTAALFELALRYGVTPQTWGAHFDYMPRPLRTAHPILLRSSSSIKRSDDYYFKGHKLPGRRMKVDKTLPIVREMSAQVNAINAFTAQQELYLGGYEHSFFQRIFSQGDTIGGDFTKGGRLYSPGKMSYQQMPSDERDLITINGAATVEVDIGSSFLTIYRAHLGLPFDPERDPYEGIGDLPRHVAKAWVVMTFGHDRHHTRWPPAARAKYRKKFEKDGEAEYGTGNLSKDHPIGRTTRTMLAALPEFADWPKSSIRWGDLQFIESQAVVEAIHTLNMVHGVTALPVHDSIRVAVPAAAVATQVLSDAFLKHVGVRPVIKAK